MPTLLDQASRLLRNAIIRAQIGLGADGVSHEDLTKHFRHTISRAEFGDAGISVPRVRLEDIRDAPHKITDWFVHSHHMDRYVMFVAWFCLWQTLLQTASCFAILLEAVDYFYDGHIGLVANLAYTFFYASFLLLYLSMEPTQLPSRTYIFGITIYTAGYASFALMAHCYHTDAELSAISYNVGSWCFITGSAALVRSLMPETSKASPLLKNLARYPGLDGSVLFLIGSAVFASDAARMGIFGGYDAVVGYALFLAGRVFFVKASATAWCGVCFQRETEALHLEAKLLEPQQL